MGRSLMRTQVHIRSRHLFEMGEINCYDLPADQVQVQIILHVHQHHRWTGNALARLPRHNLGKSCSLARLPPQNLHGIHTERLCNLIPRGEEAEVDKCGHGDAGNRVPRKLCDELKR